MVTGKNLFTNYRSRFGPRIWSSNDKGQRKSCLAIKGLRSCIFLRCKGRLAVFLSLKIKLLKHLVDNSP